MAISQKPSAGPYWEAINAIHAAVLSWIDRGAPTGYYPVNGLLTAIHGIEMCN
ncbi:hypothetical protein EYZ11_001013 [Aspergillus tanneri]|uniref:Uncharacterized protein n=1 Tax=Aspergillus tanneri TaxID=1220188 RepID=A0A4S3JVJ4_9EURO|nr:hypothetical protein EYZ11_001013 [Aspergillus tanneri]